MGIIDVDVAKLKEISGSCEALHKGVKKDKEQIAFVKVWLKGDMPEAVLKNLDKIIAHLENDKDACKDLGKKLALIAARYEKTENEISGLYKSGIKAENENKDNKPNTDKMSYDEYLEYREKNAVDENTRKLYEKYKKKVKIKDDDYDDTAHYNPTWNHINYNEDEDNENPRGRGSTYYHEVGHLIDDRSDWWGDTSSDGSYDFYNKLDNDLDNYINKIMKEKGYTKKADAYEYLSSWLWDDPDMKSGISDLVNGLSEGKACGRWLHDDDYYNERSICCEAFAHFFEAGMSDDPTKLNYIKELFPSAYEEYQRMIRDELK